MTTLVQIREKVRAITGRPAQTQLTDVALDAIINNWYLYNLPEHLRIFNLKTNYTFNLAPNVANYPFDKNTYISIEAPAYIAGYETQIFQDQRTFNQFFAQIMMKQSLTVGTGIAGPYVGTITNTPIQPNSVFISVVSAGGVSLVVQDNGTGGLTGDCTGGTINYQTGAVAALTFTAVVAAGTTVYAQTANYTTGRPQAVLFFHDTFTFYPYPDTAYPFKVQAYIVPTALIATASPLLNEWWELLAYGAALKILGDSLDTEGYAKVKILYDKQESLTERRTLKQISTQRTRTIYSDSDIYPYSTFWPYA